MSYDSWKTTPPDFFDDPDMPAECDGCGERRKLARCSHYGRRSAEWLCRECAGDDEPADPCQSELPFADNERSSLSSPCCRSAPSGRRSSGP